MFASGILSLVLMTGVAAASEKPDAETLAWCKEHGVVCLSPGEYREVAMRIVTLERDISLLRIRRLRRVGWTLGPSVGVGSGGEINASSVTLTFGWRF
jgi:hypothetical protein